MESTAQSTETSMSFTFEHNNTILPQEMSTLSEDLEQTAAILTTPVQLFSADLLDVASTLPPQPAGLPVYGYPGPVFYIIHYAAIVSLSISNIVSIGVLTYIFTWTPARHGLFKRPIGERLVVYLAVCDLLFSIFHQIDHIYMLVTKDHPPDSLCIAIAFLTHGTVLAQAVIIVFTAISTMILVVWEKRLPLGRADWKLLVLTIVIPVVAQTVGALVPYIGPMGMWCMFDWRTRHAPVVDNFYNALFVFLFTTNLGCYIAVVLTIKRSKKRLQHHGNHSVKNNYRTESVAMVLIAAYLFQFSPTLVHSIWIRIAIPHYAIYVVLAIMVNLGGVYNALAYTVLRKAILAKPKAQTQMTAGLSATSVTKVVVIE